MSNFTFFWKSHNPFSQWYLCDFEVDGIKFNCAEQYMMYWKAKYFGDERMAMKILKSPSPKEQKRFGKKVKNFNVDFWEVVCKKIVYDGNYAKFTQNPKLLSHLMETGDSLLVEASPTDEIWGIALAEDDPRAQDQSQWLGRNYLGQILTDLRETLKKNPHSDFLFLRKRSHSTTFNDVKISVDPDSEVLILATDPLDYKDLLFEILQGENYITFTKIEKEKMGLTNGIHKCSITVTSFQSNHPEDPVEWDLSFNITNLQKP